MSWNSLQLSSNGVLSYIFNENHIPKLKKLFLEPNRTMVSTLISNRNPIFPINPKFEIHFKNQLLFPSKPRIFCFNPQYPKDTTKECKGSKGYFLDPLFNSPDEQIHVISNKPKKNQFFGYKNGVSHQEMLILCGSGYYMNGFRGFPWLALNFHMAQNLHMNPSTLQLVQNFGNLPMVAKPLYGILSDAIYIGGAHRIPYISIGVILQILSWGSLALIPIAGEARVALTVCVLLSNLGAAIAEVAKDALVAEYGQKNKMHGLQSYACMAAAIGGVVGNLFGGFFLSKTQQTKSMFLAFAAILALQLSITSKTKEESLSLPQPLIPQSIRKQYSDLMVEIKEESIWRPLVWVVSSIALIPILSGSLFCYQTQFLNLDPSIIGMSKVTGQLLLLSLALLYDRFGKTVSMRKLVVFLQLLYASSLLLDLALVKQLNLQVGIPNDIFTLCFSGLAETIAQFKLLPFHVLFASLAPQGCEGSLMSFLASALCLSSIVSGFFGVGLANFLGITSGNYSSLPIGIVIQFFLALLPLFWIGCLPDSQTVSEKARRVGRSKRTRRNRRVGRVAFDDALYYYRRERESDLLR